MSATPTRELKKAVSQFKYRKRSVGALLVQATASAEQINAETGTWPDASELFGQEPKTTPWPWRLEDGKLIWAEEE